MIRPVSIKAIPSYRIYIRFSDGVEGEVDLSYLAGQGVFEAWNDIRFFEGVHIGAGRQIQWSDEIELCPDAIYLKLTGKTPEELFPELQREITNA
jgi:hypothetical protein